MTNVSWLLTTPGDPASGSKSQTRRARERLAAHLEGTVPLRGKRPFESCDIKTRGKAISGWKLPKARRPGFLNNSLWQAKRKTAMLFIF